MCIDIKRHPIAFEMKQKINIEENALKHSGKDKANWKNCYICSKMPASAENGVESWQFQAAPCAIRELRSSPSWTAVAV